MRLPLRNALRLISKAQEEDTKDYAFKIYLAVLPNMREDNRMTFNEFWEEIKPENTVYDTRSQDEIMEEISNIEKRFIAKKAVVDNGAI